jgi:protein phosphatase
MGLPAAGGIQEERISMKTIKVPEIALVLLIGPSNAGKSTFARQYFLPTEVISPDFCRALISDDENNQEASPSAFELLHAAVAQRLRLGKLTVVDAQNIRQEDRAQLIRLAKKHYTQATAPPSVSGATTMRSCSGT